MTAPKLPRNTRELTVSEAINKLRANRAERALAHAKVDADFDETDRRTLCRVPEVVRAHVALQGAEDPGPLAPEAGDASDTSWLNEEPKQTAKPIVIDRSEGRAGKGRT